MFTVKAVFGSDLARCFGFARRIGLALTLTFGLVGTALADATCPDDTGQVLAPTDRALCRDLGEKMKKPGVPLHEYEAIVGEFFKNFCHRDTESKWVHDKDVRDTGPYTQTLVDGKWVGKYFGTHSPVVIWYSPDMHEWLKINRPINDHGEPIAPAKHTEIPDGAIIAKEMYTAPAARCAGRPKLQLLPSSGIAFMVRASQASHDGWYWGWFGYSGWGPDWPPGPDNGAPMQGFGQYCTNCHASSEEYSTFSSLKNIAGENGTPLVFLSQDWALAEPPAAHHREVILPDDPAPRLGNPFYTYNEDFNSVFGKAMSAPPNWDTVESFPSATYDNVWVKAGKVSAHSEFVTSDQCAGCHDAGGTGLNFSMTKPKGPGSDQLINYSPYGTWRTSPMGLAGRDPIFFAQLASETQTFHPTKGPLIENVCFGCHGITGQRQFEIDQKAETGKCPDFERSFVNAIPYPPDNKSREHANYGALARDGISCTACHRMVQADAQIQAAMDQPENGCVAERQELLNPASLGLSGFARTVTGSYWVGPPDQLRGPFVAPKVKPMEHALGIAPVQDDTFASSEMCGTCHTVHLPVMNQGEIIGYTYEQTTYPEWLFSAYRTGDSPNGDLPLGAGDRAASCLDCHMVSEQNGKPIRSKIASIQEYSTFPQAEYALPPEDLDLETREGFARHTLVGLNVFLIKMAQQFPDVFGIPTQDPMLVKKGEPSLERTEQEMLINADHNTAEISVKPVRWEYGHLEAEVHVVSKVGHKFPSGVGFRRAFITFEVLNAEGQAIWTSGGTNGAGVIVGADGAPLAGELWWKDDCSGLLNPGDPKFQPHHQVITDQNQAQIYQELVVSPAPVENPMCGDKPAPGGDLTTSFLSICGEVKDNRLLPHGYLGLEDRITLARAIGATETLAREATAHHVGDDPDYKHGGGDSLIYRIPESALGDRAINVRATLNYQAIPPFYLQDRFCTAKGPDTERLYFLAGHLNLDETEAEGWKFNLVDSGMVSVPAK